MRWRLLQRNELDLMRPEPLAGSQVAAYRERGWLNLGQILKPATIAEIISQEERFRLDVGYGASANRNLRVNIQLCNRSEPVRRFCTSGPHLAMLQQLVGPNLCLTHQQFVTKLPDRNDERSDIPLHQDNGYGQLEPMTDITVWIPLVDTNAQNGCLHIVPGSHRGGLLEHSPAGVNPVLIEAATRESATPVEARAGEGIAFSGLTLHGSGPNHSPNVRAALYVRYCEPHVRLLSEGGRSVLDDPHSWMVCGEANP
jgi:phytanoyl-CoA hydroxylase